MLSNLKPAVERKLTVEARELETLVNFKLQVSIKWLLNNQTMVLMYHKKHQG